MDTPPEIRQLRHLARLWGVATHYRDGFGQLCRPAPETLLTLLAALGAPVKGQADVPGALIRRRRERATRVLPPGAVAWGGRAPVLPWTVPARAAETPGTAVLHLEGGGTEEHQLDADATPVVGRRSAEGGGEGVRRRLVWPGEIPPGRHRLEVRLGDPRGGRITGSTRLVAAPERLPGARHGDRGPAPRWGVFLPLHALVERPGSGLAHLGSLARLARWAAGRGAGLVGCLPLLAAFLDAEQRPFDVSPYSPASRQFWNELWVDLGSLPELAESPAARRRLAAPAMLAERRRLAALEHVDYGAEWAWRRPVWQSLADRFFSHAPEGRRESFEAFLAEKPEVESYARFRALGDLHGTPWQEWPEEHRRPGETGGWAEPPGGAGEPRWRASERRHLYAQWQAHRQMARLGASARRSGVELYQDLPLGVHPASWETWRHPRAFVPGIEVGAPPDAFFTAGQSWGFPPPAPPQAAARENQGEAALGVFRRAVRHSLEACDVLRLDHVMQLERLFWIPPGGEPADGTYVAYPREELLATVVLEASRAGSAVVGEDLGTVPPAVRRAMGERGLARMYVLPFEIRPDAEEPLTPVPAGAVASLGTHDTATFRGFWQETDLGLGRELGLLTEYRERELRRQRAHQRLALVAELRRRGLLGPEDEEPAAVMLAALRALARSPASRVLVQLEDLWGEVRPQNVPGTGPERPNWRRRAALSLGGMARAPEVVHALDTVERERATPVASGAGDSLDSAREGGP